MGTAGVPAVEKFVAVTLLFAGPIEFRSGAGETVENGEVAGGGGNFFEETADEGVAARGRDVEIEGWRWKGEGGLIGVADGRKREANRDKAQEWNNESQRQPTIHKLQS